MSFVERVAVKASEARPSRALLSILAAPFYLLGFVLGLLLVAAVWCGAAVQVGVGDARRRARPDEPVNPNAG